MHYDTVLNFVKSLLNNFNVAFTVLHFPVTQPLSLADLGLRQLLKPDIDYLQVSKNYMEMCMPKTIYRLHDFYLCNYFMFLLPPEEENNFVYIGPYTSVTVTKEMLLETYKNFSFPPDVIAQLEKYYQEVPFVPEESSLQTLLYTLGEWIWGGTDNFTVQDIPDLTTEYSFPSESAWDSRQAGDPLVAMKALEQRYAAENELIKAVSLGQVNKAEVVINQFAHRQMEQRTPDSLRNEKNYAVICNTLLRKAAESAYIHPLYLDYISTKYARKIELCISQKDVKALQRQMIHNYCLLVQNHSLKGYSTLIRKAMIQIDTDLSADLSLYSLSKILNVNASYLSTLFKKETGNTLTECVKRKRIKQAVFLLNTTNLQIQIIAQYCGIPDVNYFIRTFKKYMEMTPKEYRDFLNGTKGKEDIAEILLQPVWQEQYPDLLKPEKD